MEISGSLEAGAFVMFFGTGSAPLIVNGALKVGPSIFLLFDVGGWKSEATGRVHLVGGAIRPNSLLPITDGGRWNGQVIGPLTGQTSTLYLGAHSLTFKHTFVIAGGQLNVPAMPIQALALLY